MIDYKTKLEVGCPACAGEGQCECAGKMECAVCSGTGIYDDPDKGRIGCPECGAKGWKG